MLYDVFLSYSSNDRVQVAQLAEHLDARGVKPFFDKIHLDPGDRWQEALEIALQTSAACVVCIGSGGIGPWEIEEVRVALERRVADPAFRVIPVLLPGVEFNQIGVPAFLRQHQSIQFVKRVDEDEPLSRLVSVIRRAATDIASIPLSVVSAKRVVCISGPSAIGKDVLLHRLMARARAAGVFCEYLRKFTTREPRSDEMSESPFEFLSVNEFHARLAAGKIGCHRFSYGNHYGIDASFSIGLRRGELVFVSHRLYSEIQTFRDLARSRGAAFFAVLLTGDHRSLMARTLHRSLSEEQRRHRTQQLVEDLDLLDTSMDELRDLFDVIARNDDGRAVADTEREIWSVLHQWLVSTSPSAVAAS